MKKGIKNIKNISLSSEEKEGMFTRLDLYMKENPMKDIVAHPSVWYNIFGQVGQVKGYRYVYSIAGLVVFIFTGVGVTNAAERSLPGDVLYPVKINVNEKVKSAVAFTPKSKAKVEEGKVIRRLDEAKALVEKGEFKTEKRDQLEKEVEKSAEFIIATKEKKRKNVSGPVKDIVKMDKQNIEDDNDFKNKINSRFEEIKKVENSINLNEIKNFENKVKSRLFNDDDDKDKGEKKDNNGRNNRNLKINL